MWGEIDATESETKTRTTAKVEPESKASKSNSTNSTEEDAEDDRSHLLDVVSSVEQAHLFDRSQQRGEPDLTQEQRRSEAEKVMKMMRRFASYPHSTMCRSYPSRCWIAAPRPSSLASAPSSARGSSPSSTR